MLLSFIYYLHNHMFRKHCGIGCISLHINKSLYGIDPSVKLNLTLDSCDESGSVSFEVSGFVPLMTSVMYTCYTRSTDPEMVSL